MGRYLGWFIEAAASFVMKIAPNSLVRQKEGAEGEEEEEAGGRRM